MSDALDPARVLYWEDGIAVIDKPPGVTTQAAGQVADDLPARVREHLGLDYLGTHQRLDKGTSGVICFATDEARNASLADSLSRADKRYVAAVVGWRGDTRTLDDWLVPQRGGSRVGLKSEAEAKRAITRASVRARQGDRSLLELHIETGRTHQIRAQLAHVGAPVAGDRRYGGGPAPRLMLHAESLVLDGRRFEAPVPSSFARWLRGEDAIALVDRESLLIGLNDAAELRWALARDPQTNAYRLANGAGDGMPGLVVDVYDQHAVVSLYGDEAVAAEDVVLDVVASLGFAGVYVKRRPKQANELVDPRQTELAPAEAARGRSAPESFEVVENGMHFEVRLGDGLSTGLFLDQRRARRRVREMSAGKRVLNLFAYTCGFGVAAALGGAADVTDVDVSGAALDRGARNQSLNGVTGKRLRADCFDFLARAGRQGRRYDLIVCDPPTYATTKKRRWKSGTQWVDLARACVAIAAPGAHLLLSSNDSRMPQARFRRYVREAAPELDGLRDAKAPRDFPPPLGHDPLPRRLWATV